MRRICALRRRAYEGLQPIDDPSLNVWSFLVYARLIFCDNDAVLNISRDIWPIAARKLMSGSTIHERQVWRYLGVSLNGEYGGAMRK